MLRFIVAAILGSAAFGQSAFEVAELKVNRSGSRGSHGDVSNGRLTVTNASVRVLIAEAWSVAVADVVGPPWLDDVRLDIVAKASPPTTPDAELRVMLQNLLKDRMKLVEHTENREEPVWALTIWKGKPKLTPSTMPEKPEDSRCSFQNDGSQAHLACQHTTMARFIRELQEFDNRYIDKPLVDQTGLTGAWDFQAEWTPLPKLESEGALTLFAALQSQLGLQLESKKLSVPVVKVDSMEKVPTEN